jgi:hypothetical protein
LRAERLVRRHADGFRMEIDGSGVTLRRRLLGLVRDATSQ